MEIIPAIDIRGGHCVRLTQGDYDRETIFADDPVESARRWEREGATRIHVVDLDGAREGRPANAESIKAVLASTSAAVQVGGGIRDLETIDGYVKLGAARIVLGTVAIKDQTTVLNAVTLFRERIVAGVDARDGAVATEGWRETSSIKANDLVRQLSEIGVTRIVYTDIARDGMLAGPNFESIASVVETASQLPAPVKVIASGGVSSIGHLRHLAQLGVEAAIVGKALYTGDVGLREALDALNS